MCKFINIKIDRMNFKYQNTQYLSNISFLYSRYSRYLQDDYASECTYSNMLEMIERCGDLFFAIINIDNNEFAGFVYLDNLTGNREHLHSAEITVCFEKKYWGAFTRKAALKFFTYCFDELGLLKLKAQIYSFNSRVRSILEFSGFKLDGILRGETIKDGVLADIEVYSLLKGDRELTQNKRKV